MNATLFRLTAVMPLSWKRWWRRWSSNLHPLLLPGKKWRKWESSRDRGFVLLLGMQCIIINYIYYIINKYNCFSTCGDQSLLSRHRRHWCIQQAKALHSIDNVEIISIEEEWRDDHSSVLGILPVVYNQRYSFNTQIILNELLKSMWVMMKVLRWINRLWMFETLFWASSLETFKWRWGRHGFRKFEHS